ncbi:hypothetical protein F6476_02725 [Pseudomonas umsongensis]|jgi:hypothetical protein|nr:hypothetical protein F6476_02725 [Pseudomonas umsongensis]SDS19599.1 hypothetical protein SAMN04490206_0320 [Pseudomonas umsongensis]
MLAMVANDDAGYLTPRGDWDPIASMLAPTGRGDIPRCRLGSKALLDYPCDVLSIFCPRGRVLHPFHVTRRLFKQNPGACPLI